MVELQNTFEFGDVDVAANRDGKLTEWQQRRLKEKQSKALLDLLLAAGIGVVGFFSLSIPLIKLLFIAFVAFIVFSGFQHWQNFNRDMQLSSTVHSLKGWASKHKRFSRYDGFRYVYSLDLGGTSFTINRTQFETVIEGMEYRVHYSPLTRTLLSIEKVEKEKT